MQKIKIAVLGTRGFPNVQGGVETHCENLYTCIVKHNCDIVVFTRKPYTGAKRRNYKGITLWPLWCPKNKFLETFIHTFMGVFTAKHIMPDILHIHAIGPSMFTPLARLMGMKVVVTDHGPDYKRKKWGIVAKFILRTSEALGIIFANEIICISKTIADDIVAKFNRNIHVIPNGIASNKALASYETLKKYSIEKNRYILAVGRVVPEKGFDYLMDAFGMIKDGRIKDGEWKLVIVGTADHKDRYAMELEDKTKDNPNVILAGFLSGQSLQELYSHAGLFVLPSYYEGLPFVLLEAMSYGLSCLASDIPANREVGLPAERYFKTGDVRGLAGKISMFAARPVSTAEKEKQIALISKKYNWDNIAKETLEIYKRILTG